MILMDFMSIFSLFNNVCGVSECQMDTLRTQLKQAQDRVKALENQLTGKLVQNLFVVYL